MARVASCNDCGAKFKVPETTQAARAKCPKCGGVVAIPPAGEAAPAAAPAAAAAPAPKASVAPKAAAAAPRAATPQAKRAAAPRAAAPTAAPSRSAAPKAGAKAAATEKKSSARQGKGAARGGSRKAKGKAEKTSSNTGMIVGLVVVVLIAAGAGWWFGFRDDGSTTTADTTAMGNESSANELDGAADTSAGAAMNTASKDGGEMANDSSGQAVAPGAASAMAGQSADADDSESGDAGSFDALAALTAPSATASGGDAPDVEQAPAAEKPVKIDPAEPMDTLIQFDAFGPVEGVSQEDLDQWTAKLHELYIDGGGATGRTRKRLRAEVAEIDIIQITPAFLNAIIGVDLLETNSILGVFTMVKDWQTRVGSTPTFFFDGDVNATGIIDQNKRVTVVNLWVGWWDGYASGKNNLDDYRAKMEGRLKSKDN
ncbi:MAG: hypothetical protein ACI9EF_000862 [Pseudohongiellaceae bacterium]|jgi:hypothetical protein